MNLNAMYQLPLMPSEKQIFNILFFFKNISFMLP